MCFGETIAEATAAAAAVVAAVAVAAGIAIAAVAALSLALSLSLPSLSLASLDLSDRRFACRGMPHTACRPRSAAALLSLSLRRRVAGSAYRVPPSRRHSLNSIQNSVADFSSTPLVYVYSTAR